MMKMLQQLDRVKLAPTRCSTIASDPTQLPFRPPRNRDNEEEDDDD